MAVPALSCRGRGHGKPRVYPWAVTEYEAWSLTTQWITAGAAVLAVLVAVVFGWLTLATSRRSKDAQDRASYAAAEVSAPMSAEFAQAVAEIAQVNWEVNHHNGETWLLRNSGTTTAFDVELEGLTPQDQSRLTTVDIGDLGPTSVTAFTFVNRFTLSGPGNLVVNFSLMDAGPRVRRIVRVPAI